MQLTVAQAARCYARHPDTLRRWIREGRLRAEMKDGVYLVDEHDLDVADPPRSAPLPKRWRTLPSGAPMFDVVKAIHENRRGR